MWYLVLGITIGVITSKYIFPILDMLLELLNYHITKLCTSIQIDTQLMSLEYQEIAEQSNQLTPVVGYHAGMSEDDYYDEEEEEEEEDKRNKKRGKIGFH